MPKAHKSTIAIKGNSRPVHKPGGGIAIPLAPRTKPDTNIKGKSPTAPAIATPATTSLGRVTKQPTLITLLQRPTGATMDEMAKAMGWQRHSVRGMMSGVLKKKLGLTITSESEERGRVYRITGSVSRL